MENPVSVNYCGGRTVSMKSGGSVQSKADMEKCLRGTCGHSLVPGGGPAAPLLFSQRNPFSRLSLWLELWQIKILSLGQNLKSQYLRGRVGRIRNSRSCQLHGKFETSLVYKRQSQNTKQNKTKPHLFLCLTHQVFSVNPINIFQLLSIPKLKSHLP